MTGNPSRQAKLTPDQSRLLAKKPKPASDDEDAPPTLEDLEEFGVVKTPEAAEEPIFPKALQATFQNWIYELNNARALATVGVKPRLRALMEGPPGTGKTSAAGYLAARLGINMVVVEVPSLIAGFIGHTGIKIGRLFDVARATDTAIFLDEIDSIASKREEGSGGGSRDQNNQVIALMQMIDRHPGLLFAATNRADILDPAVWRRFNMQIHVGMPDDESGFAIVKRYLQPLMLPDEGIDLIWAALSGLSPAVIKEVMEGVRRDFVLAPRLGLDASASAAFDRIRRSIRPSDEGQKPLLWSDAESTLRALADMPWPPTKAA